MAKNVLDGERKKEKKRLYSVTAVTFAVIYTLCCFVISPIYTSTVSNIAYSQGILPDLIILLNNVLEVLAISVAYAALIRGLLCFGVKGCMGGIGIFMGATLYKYIANMLLSWYYAGSISRELWSDILNVLFYVALEGIQLAIVVLIVNRTVRGDREKAEYFRKEGISAEIAAEKPIKKLYDGKHPLCRAALYCAIVVFLSKMLGEIFNDVLTILWFGLPQKAPTVFLMILNYLSTVVFGAVCYAVVVMTLSWLMEKRGKM